MLSFLNKARLQMAQSKVEAERKLFLCKECPHSHTYLSVTVCGICKCDMNIKVHIPGTQCADPTNKRW